MIFTKRREMTVNKKLRYRKYLILFTKILMKNAAAGAWNEVLKHASYYT